MKKILLFLVFAFAASFSYAQLHLSSGVYDTLVDASVFDIELHTDIETNSAGSIEVEWTRTIVYKTKSWSTYVCSGVNCYPPETEYGTFTVSPGKSSPLMVHFGPNNVSGNAEVEIKINEKANPGNSVTAVYKVTAKGVATKNVTVELVRIYPNPTADYFKIQNTPNVSKVVLSNLMGRTVKSFAGVSDRYDVGDLPAGMYIVQLQDATGRNLKTSRLSIKKP